MFIDLKGVRVNVILLQWNFPESLAFDVQRNEDVLRKRERETERKGAGSKS